jgi:hypothetical protein
MQETSLIRQLLGLADASVTYSFRVESCSTYWNMACYVLLSLLRVIHIFDLCSPSIIIIIIIIIIELGFELSAFCLLGKHFTL